MRIRHIKGAEEALASEPLVINEPENFRGRWGEKIFQNPRPLFVEIGAGMGRFIRSLSPARRENNYIGIELNATVLYKAVRRYREELAPGEDRRGDQLTAHGRRQGEKLAASASCRGKDRPFNGSECDTGQQPLSGEEYGAAAPLTDGKVGSGRPSNGAGTIAGNLRFIWGNARFLSEYFADSEVSGIYLNFPDPWPKKKSAGRRLTAPQYLKLYQKVLKPDGILEFKTDNKDLFDYSVGTLRENGWEITSLTHDLHNDPALSADNIMTEYEEKFSGKGNPIYKLTALPPE